MEISNCITALNSHRVDIFYFVYDVKKKIFSKEQKN